MVQQPEAPANPRAPALPGFETPARPATRGVLPSDRLRELVRDGVISASETLTEDQFQPASLDLRLGPVAYQIRASFLPGSKATVMEAVNELLVQQLDLSAGAVLHPKSVYIIPLQERVDLVTPNLSARANPKSTTGRLDVFARLLTDYTDRFDVIEPTYRGPLFVEVSPKTFSVFARAGDRLNQVRFRRSRPNEYHSSAKAAREAQLLWGDDGQPIPASDWGEGIWFTIDTRTGLADDIVGWKAKHHSPVIDLRKVNHYPIREFWEPVHSAPFLILEVGSFYILGSTERVLVPPAFAAEMVAYDQAMGEFRVHYAGFFDPGFGYHEGKSQGTRAILEVRSHEIPYVLRDGQPVGRLQFESMLALPSALYGAGSGSSYQDQGLGLSKQFQRTISRD